jgi:hypothetical protein
MILSGWLEKCQNPRAVSPRMEADFPGRRTTKTVQPHSNLMGRHISGPKTIIERIGAGMVPQTSMQKEAPEKIPAELSKQLRTLAHDLSNSIETIMQACYLLNQGKLDDTSKKWAELIDNGARDAAKINRQIRDVLRTHST